MLFIQYYQPVAQNEFSDTELDANHIIASHLAEQFDEPIIDLFETEPNYNA